MNAYWKSAPCRGCDGETLAGMVYCDRCQEEVDAMRETREDLDWFERAWGWFAILLISIGAPCVLFNLVRWMVTR